MLESVTVLTNTPVADYTLALVLMGFLTAALYDRLTMPHGAGTDTTGDSVGETDG